MNDKLMMIFFYKITNIFYYFYVISTNRYTMKNLITILFLVFACNLANAQKDKMSENVKKQIELLKKADLNLSDIQLTRITHVLVSDEQIIMKNKKSFESNKPLLESKLAEIKLYRINNIKGAMTPQQAEKFDALKLADKL